MKRRDAQSLLFLLDEAFKQAYNIDNNILAKEVKQMNKTDFIAELAKKTGLSVEDGAKVNDVLENNNLLTNAGKIVSEIATKLGIGEEQAKDILEKAKEIMKGGIMDKIKMPFGGQ